MDADRFCTFSRHLNSNGRRRTYINDILKRSVLYGNRIPIDLKARLDTLTAYSYPLDQLHTEQSATLTAICQDAINPTHRIALPRHQLTTHGRRPPPTGRGCSPEAQLQAQCLKVPNSGLRTDLNCKARPPTCISTCPGHKPTRNDLDSDAAAGRRTVSSVYGIIICAVLGVAQRDGKPAGNVHACPSTEKPPWTRHKAIIAYLSANNLSSSATALRTELGLAEDVFDAATAKKYEGLIEKKWTSVVRLQKKARLPVS